MSKTLKTTMSKEAMPTMFHKIDLIIKEKKLTNINHIKFCCEITIPTLFI